MAIFPGPSELQIHFEKIHSGLDGSEDNEKLLNLDDDGDNEDVWVFMFYISYV